VADVIEARKAQYPDEPWLWRPDWADGIAVPRATEGVATIVGYGIVAIAALVAAPWLATALPAEEPLWPARGVLWGLAILLASAGGAAAFLAVRRTRAHRAFGRVWMQLDTVPAFAGGILRGAIHADRPFDEGTPATLRLVCVLHARTKAYVDGYSTNVWEHATSAIVSGGVIPVEFAIPADHPESDPDIPDRQQRCSWDFQVRIAESGATYAGVFQVPVFAKDRVDSCCRNGAPRAASTS